MEGTVRGTGKPADCRHKRAARLQTVGHRGNLEMETNFRGSSRDIKDAANDAR